MHSNRRQVKPHHKTETFGAPRLMPGSIIFVHGVNSEGEWYADAAKSFARGLNRRLGRLDITELGRPGAEKRAERHKAADDRMASPFIPFYWGYSAHKKECFKDCTKNVEGTTDIWTDVFNNPLRQDRTWGRGPFANGTTTLQEFWGVWFNPIHLNGLGRSAAGEKPAAGEEELKLRRNKAPAGQPVIAISGAAGIASATPRDHLQYAGINIDTVAGHHQQHYAGDSIISTAGEAIDQVTLRGDIRSIANAGKIIQQAQHNSIEITAEKSLVLTSSEDEVVIRGKKGITLVLEDGTYLRLAGGQVTTGMNGSFTVKSSGLNLTGPGCLLTELLAFNLASQASRIRFHYGTDKPQTLPGKAFAIVKAGGEVTRGDSDGEALADTPVGKALNIGI